MKQKILLTFMTLSLLLFSTLGVFSQTCADFSFTATSTPSTCQKNGTISVTVTPDVASLIVLNTAQYSVTSVIPGGYSTVFVQIPDGVITEVPSGTYTVKMRAFCSELNDWVVSTHSANVTVGGNYEIPSVDIGAMRKSLNCLPTGLAPIIVSGGKAPYNVTITNAPAAYTGRTSFSLSSAGTLNLDSLNPGAYTINVLDQCTYSISKTITVQAVASDFPSFLAYPYLFPPTPIGDCGMVRTYGTYSSLSSDDDLHYYWNLNQDKYYEVAQLWDTTQAKAWGAPSSFAGRRNISLPLGETYKTLRDNPAKNKYYTFARVKGSTEGCQVFGTSYIKAPSMYFSSNTEYCDHYTQSFKPWEDYDGVFCYPITYTLAKDSCNGEVVDAGTMTSPVTKTLNMEYGQHYYLCYQDASGDQSYRAIFNSAYTSSGNIAYSTSSCKAVLGQGYVYLHSLNTTDSIRFISGPQAPSIPVVDWSGGSNYYPYGSSHTNMPEGTYTFELTDTCGLKKTVSIYYKSYSISGFSYTADTTCNGLQVYPEGQMKYGVEDISTYFHVISAPDGVDLSQFPNDITVGGYFNLQAPGHYTLSISPEDSEGYCFSDTIGINYTKNGLSLDPTKTAAYVCPGNTTGNISVKGKGGSGNYQYELLGSGLPANTTGKFQYGVANGTYTVRVTDVTCATSFEQAVTISDLNVASIAWADKSSGEYCFGDTLGLNCLSLGDTEYHWAGPNGYLSSDQNPDIYPITASMSGTYNVTVTAENCNTEVTQGVNVNITGFTTMSLNTDSVDACENTPFTLTGTVSPTPVSYSWSKSGTSLPGATGTYTDASGAVSDSGNYVLTVLNDHNCAARDTTHVQIYPLYSQWIAQDGNSEWNNALNWDRGIPGACTYATISKGRTYYPTLLPGNIYRCDTIAFEFGGEVANTYLLQYNAAKVEADVRSGRWTMLSSPLQDMYSGDYYLTVPSNRWDPAVYMQKYQSANPQTNIEALTGGWTGAFNTLNEELPLGLGYVVWPDKAPDNTVCSFSFPKKDMTYTYYYTNGTPGNSSTIPTRSSGSRFAYESAAPVNGNFVMDVSSADKVNAPTTIVGNPFMSHLDFFEFWDANDSKIENKYYVWSTGAFDATAQTGGGFVSTSTSSDRYIAPMQSFIVTKKTPGALLTSLDMNSNKMAVTLPGNTLRNITSLENMMKVELSDERGSSRVAVRYVPGEIRSNDSQSGSMYTLFPSRLPADREDAAVVYAVEKGKAMSILNVDNYIDPIELGIRSVRTGTFSLKALNLNTFAPSVSVYLVDKRIGLEQNLREDSVYSFIKETDGDIVDRFYIRLEESATGIAEVASGDIQIYASEGKLYVKSSFEPLVEVEVIGINGIRIARQSGLDAQSLVIDLPLSYHSQAIIVKTATRKVQKTEKILLK